MNNNQDLLHGYEISGLSGGWTRYFLSNKQYFQPAIEPFKEHLQYSYCEVKVRKIYFLKISEKSSNSVWSDATFFMQ